MFDLAPIRLDGRHVRLEPLSHAHKPALAEVAFDPDLWQFTPTQIHSAADLDEYVTKALSEHQNGHAQPFAIVNRATDAAIGSTRLGNLDHQNLRVEIGWTWLGRAYHRRAYNTEAKLLLFSHAFERLECIRVEFKVDVLNIRSRRAVERLGAKEEGTLRRHMILPNGRTIDWVVYSVLSEEWPAVRANLENKLASHAENA